MSDAKPKVRFWERVFGPPSALDVFIDRHGFGVGPQFVAIARVAKLILDAMHLHELSCQRRHEELLEALLGRGFR